MGDLGTCHGFSVNVVSPVNGVLVEAALLA